MRRRLGRELSRPTHEDLSLQSFIYSCVEGGERVQLWGREDNLRVLDLSFHRGNVKLGPLSLAAGTFTG